MRNFNSQSKNSPRDERMESVPGDTCQEGERVYGIQGLGDHQCKVPESTCVYTCLYSCTRVGGAIKRNTAVYNITAEERKGECSLQ